MNNEEDNDYVLYGHYLKGTNILAYLGSGRKSRAMVTSGGRNELYNIFECFYGMDKFVIAEGLTKQEALEIETELIRQYSKEYPDTLTNKQHSGLDKKVILLSKCGKFYVMKDFEEGGFRKLRDQFYDEWVQERLSKYELKVITDETEYIKNRTEINLFRDVLWNMVSKTPVK